MKKMILTLSLGLLALVFIVACPLWATDYHVDQNHPNANDQNMGTIDQPWRTITKANQTLKAGDTVYIRAGTYNSYIAPNNSGSPGSRITYQNYGTDVVTISGASNTIYLNGKNYITVQGINGTGNTSNLYIIGGSYNIIAYCNFTLPSVTNWDSSVINNASQYNWIHHCRFSKAGECSAGGSDNGTVLDIGIEGSSTDLTRYNLIEDCILFHGGHHVLGLFGSHNMIRNNYFHNEEWSRSRGNRTIYLNGKDVVTGYNIIEGNRFGYAARPCDDYTVGSVAISTKYNIFRYNKIYHSNAYGLGLATYPNYSVGSYNKIYNNTFFNNGYNIYPSFKGGQEDSAITFWYAAPTGNVLKNNLYYSHNRVYGASGNDLNNHTFANDFNGDTRGDPKFVNASTTPPTDKMDSALPNLDLQSNSPAIDAGGALTTVAAGDTGSGTFLIVTDARYFQDGSWAPPGAVHPDWIAVGSVGNAVQISSINHSTNTITLANPISRNDGDSVWLYKKSDGVRVLYGSAPDAGAYEFPQDPAPLPPKNLRIIE